MAASELGLFLFGKGHQLGLSQVSLEAVGVEPLNNLVVTPDCGLRCHDVGGGIRKS